MRLYEAKKDRSNALWVILAGVIALLLISGCRQLHIEDDPIPLETGVLEIIVNEANRTVLPDNVAFSKYGISFQPQADQAPVASIETSGPVTVTLALGTWKITVLGYEEEVPLAKGEKTVTITRDRQSVTIPVTVPVEGTGTFSYAVTLPTGITITEATLTLSKVEEGNPSFTKDLQDTGTSGTISTETGFYDVKLIVSGGDPQVSVKRLEVAQIYPDKTTSYQIEITEANLNSATDPTDIAVGTAIEEDAAITLLPENGVYTIAANESVKVVLNGAVSPTWYIDGVELSASNGAQEIVFEALNYDVGVHYVVAKVVSNGAVYSKEYQVRITEETDEPVIPVINTYIVNSSDDFTLTLAAIRNNSDVNSNIVIGVNISLMKVALTDAAYQGKTITISSEGSTRIISLSGNGSLFTVGSGVILVLNDITLRGHDTNTTPLVSITGGGTLEMNDGANISNNTNSASRGSLGGGVNISGGIFNMKGGTISGNILAGRSGGGGVHLTRNNSIFNMSGGIISANKVTNTSSDSSAGGGVYLDNSSATSTRGTSFVKTGGIIYGSNASTSQKNTVGYGAAAVYGSSGKSRNTTADDSVTLDSNHTGRGGGWD